MALDSLGSDINKISTVKPVLPTDFTQAFKPENNTTQPLASVGIEKDGANVNSSKGKIPASVFGGDDSPAFMKDADSAISKNSTNKKQLQTFLSVLEKLDVTKGIDNLSPSDINELMNLGFDVTMENGQVSIADQSGNKIDLNDFVKSQEGLKSTLKRAISGTSNLDPISKPQATKGTQSTSSISATKVTASVSDVKDVQPKKMSEDQQQQMLLILQEDSETNKHVATVSEPLKQDLEKNIKEYDDMVNKADQQTKKVDMSISTILSLKEKAQALVDKGKKQPLSETEKKQLNSYISTMDLKQKELRSNQASSELLLKQVDQAFDQIEPNLSTSEKETKSVMQSALKAKINGQATTARQDFVTAIAEEAYKITSNMSTDELDKFMSDPSARLKAFSPINKLIDKMSTAKNLSEFSQDDLKTLWDKFKIKAQNDDNGNLVLVHYSSDGKTDNVVNDDIKNFRTDLNNIVTSPDLFKVARASGQLAIAYDKPFDLKEPSKGTANTDSVQNIEDKKIVQPKVEVSTSDENEKTSNPKNNLAVTKEEKQDRATKWSSQTSLDNAMEKKEEEEKYHQKQLSGIQEKRHEINKYIEKTRAEFKQEQTQIQSDNKKMLDKNKELEKSVKVTADNKKAV